VKDIKRCINSILEDMLLDQHVSGETEETLEIPQNRLFARQCSNPGPSEHEVGVVKYYLLRNVR
jgi:hypothetical protein